MPNFTLLELTHYNTKQKVYRLSRDGRCYYDEFIEEIKKDKNLEPELGDLIPTIKYVADFQKPILPKQRYRKLKLGKNARYSVFEAKSNHLRLYVFVEDSGLIIILGGKKTEQDADIKKIEKLLKEYCKFQNNK